MATGDEPPRSGVAQWLMRMEYQRFWSLKQWAKVNTPLSRFMTDLGEVAE